MVAACHFISLNLKTTIAHCLSGVPIFCMIISSLSFSEQNQVKCGAKKEEMIEREKKMYYITHKHIQTNKHKLDINLIKCEKK